MRRIDREIKGIIEIMEIIEKAKILHLGLIDNNYPYIVPLHYGFEYNDGFIFYIHSAKEGHKLDLIRENNHVSIELECNVNMLSGKDIPCDYSSTYSSFMGKGKAYIVNDLQEKIKGLKILMKNQTGRDFEFDERMANSVCLVKIVIEDYSAKGKR